MCAKKYVIKCDNVIIGVCWNLDLAKKCFRDLKKYDNKNYKCIIYENGKIIGWFNENVYIVQLNLFEKEVFMNERQSNSMVKG